MFLFNETKIKKLFAYINNEVAISYKLTVYSSLIILLLDNLLKILILPFI